jgi:hypothetical protein
MFLEDLQNFATPAGSMGIAPPARGLLEWATGTPFARERSSIQVTRLRAP